MGVAQGYSKIVTSGSVFIYDTGDTFNSFKGEPTTNLVLDPDGNANVITTDVPFQTNVIGYAQYSSGYYVNPRNTTATSATGKTFTYSVYMRSTSVPKSTYLMYVYTGTGPDGGWWYFGDGNLTSDWQRYTYTRSDLTGTVSIVTVYRYNQQGTIDIAAPQLEVNSHATQFVKGTRSATQGLLDISGKGTVIDLSSVSFTSTAQPTFDGTDDQILMDSYASNIPYGGNITVETVVKYNAFSPNDVIVAYGGNNTNFGWLHQYEFTQGLMFGIQNNPNYGSAYIGTTASQQYLNKYIHMLGLYNGSQVQLYINGSLAATQAFSSGIPQATTFRIGNESGRSYYSNMDLPVAKIYNRALSEAEIKQNFDHYKNRFNIASPLYVYSEGPRADLYTANWNNSTTYTMANFGGIANVTAHGWTSGPATYTLTLNQLPPHTKVRYRVYWHLVDSLDNETNQLFIMNSSGTETEILRFTKQYNQAPVFSVVGTNVTNAWSGPQVYTYRPWANGAYNADGYIVVDSGLQDHTATSFTARHVLGADQAQADEAEYLSHVEVLLY